MQKIKLIQFAEGKIEQFKNDILNAHHEENELSNILIELNYKKNEYWNQIMECLQIYIAPKNLELAYSDIAKYHTQFQNMLEEFVDGNHN